MRIGRGLLLATGFAAVLLAGLLTAPPASAALPLGGGAGIIVDGTYCTLNTIGHDKTGELVGFTAAHCGGPDSPVVAEGSENLGPLGTVVSIANDPRLDYSVIKFDPAKVTPITDFAGFVINGIGPDPDEWHQPACKLGAASGDICSDISSLPGPGARVSVHGLYQPGDDGGPVTYDDQLIGMMYDGHWLSNAGLPLPPTPVTYAIKFSRILDDVNANGGPGAGFTPIGS